MPARRGHRVRPLRHGCSRHQRQRFVRDDDDRAGVYSEYAAKFTFTFKGDYDGANSSGVASLSGTFRETVTYTDSAARTCSSGNQTWTATRDTQPAQSSALPPVGSYTAENPQNGAAITFYVSFKKTALQDISIPDVYLSCAPDTTTASPTTSPWRAVALKPDGSFNGTTTQQGSSAAVTGRRSPTHSRATSTG